MNKPLDQLTDAEINAKMAEWLGHEIEPLIPTSPGVLVLTPYIDDEGNELAAHEYFDPLHDSNALAEVKAKLRELNYGYGTQWACLEDGKLVHEAYVDNDKLDHEYNQCVQYHKNENRAFCLAVCAMRRGKDD